MDLPEFLDRTKQTVSSASGPGTLGGASLVGDSGMYDTGVIRLECRVIEIKELLSPLDCDDKVDLRQTHISNPHGVHAVEREKKKRRTQGGEKGGREEERVHDGIDHGSDKGAVHQAFPT